MKNIPKFQKSFKPLGLSQDNTTITQPINHSNMIRYTQEHEKYLREKHPNSKLSYGELAQLDRDINSKQQPIITNPPTRFETEQMKQNRLAYQQKVKENQENEITPEQYGQALGALEFMGYATLPFDLYGIGKVLKTPTKMVFKEIANKASKSKPIIYSIMNRDKFPYFNIPFDSNKYYRVLYNSHGDLAQNAITDANITGIIRSNPKGSWIANGDRQYFVGPYFTKGKPKFSIAKNSKVIVNDNPEINFVGINPHAIEFKEIPESTQFTPIFNGTLNQTPAKYFHYYERGTGPITKHLWFKKQFNPIVDPTLKPKTILKTNNTQTNTSLSDDLSTLILRKTFLEKYKKGGKLISKFKNSGKVRLYTNPFFNQNISPLDANLKEGIDYNLVTQEYYNQYKNKQKAKELGAEGYFESNLWESENPIKKGYNKNTNTWGSYNDGTGNYVGPGVDFNLYGTKEEINKIKNKILSSGELNNMIKRVVKLHSNSAEKQLSKYTSRPDTISPQIKAGFYDILYQSGPYSKWKNLSKAIAEGNLQKIHEEAKTYTKANKKKELDTRRLNERKNKYFHY